MEIAPGTKVYVSNISEEQALKDGHIRYYICKIPGYKGYFCICKDSQNERTFLNEENFLKPNTTEVKITNWLYVVPGSKESTKDNGTIYNQDSLDTNTSKNELKLLIADQQLEIVKLKDIKNNYEKALNEINGLLYCCGGPLNDNFDKYTKEQLEIFFKIANLIRNYK
jgi:hypothetical protein